MRIPPKSVIIQKRCQIRVLSPKDGHSIYRAVNESLPSLKRFMHWAHFVGDFEEALSIYSDFQAKALKGEEANFAGFEINSGEFRKCSPPPFPL